MMGTATNASPIQREPELLGQTVVVIYHLQLSRRQSEVCGAFANGCTLLIDAGEGHTQPIIIML
jgi:hypothetical protein